MTCLATCIAEVRAASECDDLPRYERAVRELRNQFGVGVVEPCPSGRLVPSRPFPSYRETR